MYQILNININEFNNKFKKNNNKLAKYIYLVKQSRLSARIPASDYTFDDFCESLKMFSYLRDCRVSFLNIGTSRASGQQDLQKIVLDCSDFCLNKNTSIDFNYSLCVLPGFGVYYMEDFIVDDARFFDLKMMKNQKITVNYVQFGGYDQFSIDLSETEIAVKSEYFILGNTVIEDFLLNYDI